MSRVTKMDAKIRAARQQKLREWNAQWTQQQLKRGVDGPVPEGRPAGSDYNQHVPMLESSGAAQDIFFARADAIMRMGPKELGLEEDEEASENV